MRSPVLRPSHLRRGVGLLALGYAALAAFAPPATLTISAAESTLMEPGETIRVSGGDTPDPYMTAGSPAITDDGRLVAYQEAPSYYGASARRGPALGSTMSAASLTSELPSEVWLGNLGTGSTERLSPPGVEATVPSISGDGRLVAFTQTSDSFTETGGYSTTTDVYVVDRAVPDKPVTRRVTTRRGDLPYQRALECNPDLYSDEDNKTAGSCGAKLSGDGRSIVLPVKQSVVTSHLRFDVEGAKSVPFLDYYGQGLAVVEIQEPEPDPYEPPEPPYQRTVTVTITGGDPVRFTDVVVTSDDGSLALGEAACEGRFKPGESCSIVVEFTPNKDGCGTTYGMLTINSPTPAGQSAIALVGDRYRECVAPVVEVTAAATDCPALPTPWDDGDPRPAPSGDETINYRELRIGEATLVEQVLTNTSGGDREVTFSSPDCSVQLLDPPPKGDPATCTHGKTLGPDGSCTAYLVFAPTSVGPSAATLALSYSGTGSNPLRVRVVGAGVQYAVVARRDPTGNGDFGCGCSPRARLVSVDSKGGPMDGAAPSVSTDGRYVAFVSGLPYDNPAQRHQQVYVHDTDRRGDGTWQPGRTTNVSFVEGPDGPERTPIAVQPSLSGDGNRIAFVTQEADGPEIFGSQVQVRDLVRRTTRLVSVPTGSTTRGDGFSYSPSLSRDGSTVAFTSSARDLVPKGARTEGAQVYVRDLGPDFDGTGPARTEIISLRAYENGNYEWGGQPATNADGGITAFTFMDSLVAENEAYYDTVYARARHASPAVQPESLSFPAQEVGTVGPPRAITLSNGGPGPIPPISVQVDGPFTVRNGCATTSLHRGETCQVELFFAPTEPGPIAGRAVLNTSAGYVLPGEAWIGDVFEIPLTGTAVPLMLRLDPSDLQLPGTGIGTVGKSLTVTASNASGQPMRITAGFAEGADHFRVGRTSVVGVGANRLETTQADCATVVPGGTCSMSVAYAPTALGDQTGLLLVTATVNDIQVSQSVAVRGTTAEPEFEFQPTVAREGRVVFLSGRNFLPGEPVELVWSSGTVSAPEVVPDTAGEFTVPVVLLKAGEPGRRGLTLTMPGIGSVEGEPLLVVVGSLQPPDFVSRN